MNAFDDIFIDQNSFSYDELQGRDSWQTFAPVFGSLTIVGAPSYLGRLRFVGRQCQFQVQFSAATSIASVAGTDFFTLPVSAMGLAGLAVMTNKTTNVAVGVCHVDSANSKCYLP
ncbi:hypothetical protein WHK35_14585, partial [Staphylococcus aureus]|uniref:hypothetical protein n=1 Tax=Staphylococcus aureus TaxID=1280 RepID=UPI0039BDC81B